MTKLSLLAVLALAILAGCSEPKPTDPFKEDRKKVFKDGPMSGTDKPLTVPGKP